MKNVKHVGRMKNNNAKVLVVFRSLPGESNSALVLGTSTLSDSYHDAIMKLVESEQGQQAQEFGNLLSVRHFPDGNLMLQTLHQSGKLSKVNTSDVLMTPNSQDSISLDELNALIAEQQGIAVDELSTNIDTKLNGDTEVQDVASVQDMTAPTPATQEQPLTDEDLAKSYRSQADAMYKEAARLRREADELDPPKKKSVKAKATADA